MESGPRLSDITRGTADRMSAAMSAAERGGVVPSGDARGAIGHERWKMPGLPSMEKVRGLVGTAWGTFWTNEQLKTNLAVGAMTAAARMYLSAGSGGADVAIAATFGAGKGAYMEWKFKDKAERHIVQAAVRGAAYGALGTGVGELLKHTGLADYAADRVGGFISTHNTSENLVVAGSTIAGGLIGLGERVRRYRKTGKFSKGKATAAVLMGALGGFLVGEGLVQGAEVMKEPGGIDKAINSAKERWDQAGGWWDEMTGKGAIQTPTLTPRSEVPIGVVTPIPAATATSEIVVSSTPVPDVAESTLGAQAGTGSPEVSPPSNPNTTAVSEASNPSVTRGSGIIETPEQESIRLAEERLAHVEDTITNKLNIEPGLVNPDIQQKLDVLIDQNPNLFDAQKNEVFNLSNLTFPYSPADNFDIINLEKPDDYYKGLGQSENISSLKGLIEGRFGEIVLRDPEFLIQRNGIIEQLLQDPKVDEGVKESLRRILTNSELPTDPKEFTQGNGAHQLIFEKFKAANPAKFKQVFDASYVMSKVNTDPSRFAAPDLFKHNQDIKVPKLELMKKIYKL